MIPAVGLALAAGGAVAMLRWLRVAQREHYLAGSVSRFAWRWWSVDAGALALAGVAVGGAVASAWYPPAALATAVAVAAGPPGLSLRGRSSQLAWTPRLRRLAAGAAVGLVVLAAVGMTASVAVTAFGVVLLPGLTDLTLALLRPVERRSGDRWVAKAASQLASSGATVVAITGSYGKTGTKGYVSHLVGGRRRVLASPASFNNRLGLARAINENLAGGIDVFVAEMGAYGPGEIAELCAWIPPDIAVITAIGPVHLERFGTVERIVAAKSEILAGAPVAVLNVDDPHLARVAAGEAGRRRVVRVGTSDPAGLEVAVAGGTVYVGGRPVGAAPPGAHASNLACAVAVALELDVPEESVGERLPSVPEAAHRRTLVRGTGGVTIIDDTFNSNPAGARAALATLAGLAIPGRRVVVTPGMVELGRLQADENRAFAAEAARVADVVIVVGRTNRAALRAGAGPEGVEVREAASREEAVAWVRANLGPDDAVLYENDLPDHYP